MPVNKSIIKKEQIENKTLHALNDYVLAPNATLENILDLKKPDAILISDNDKTFTKWNESQNSEITNIIKEKNISNKELRIIFKDLKHKYENKVRCKLNTWVFPCAYEKEDILSEILLKFLILKLKNPSIKFSDKFIFTGTRDVCIEYQRSTTGKNWIKSDSLNQFKEKTGDEFANTKGSLYLAEEAVKTPEELYIIQKDREEIIKIYSDFINKTKNINHRNILILRYKYGLIHADIAKILKIKTDSVSKTLSRLEPKLKNELINLDLSVLSEQLQNVIFENKLTGSYYYSFCYGKEVKNSLIEQEIRTIDELKLETTRTPLNLSRHDTEVFINGNLKYSGILEFSNIKERLIFLNNETRKLFSKLYSEYPKKKELKDFAENEYGWVDYFNDLKKYINNEIPVNTIIRKTKPKDINMYSCKNCGCSIYSYEDLNKDYKCWNCNELVDNSCLVFCKKEIKIPEGKKFDEKKMSKEEFHEWAKKRQDYILEQSSFDEKQVFVSKKKLIYKSDKFWKSLTSRQKDSIISNQNINYYLNLSENLKILR